MKTLLALAAAIAITLPVFADDPPKPAEKSKLSDKPIPTVYDENADAKKLIADATAAAKRENRRVLVQWGGNWCSWCILLHEKFKSDKVLSKTLRYEYDVVHIDSKNKELMDHYKADSKKGVPYLTVLDADGKVLANEETEQFETKIDGKNGHDAEKLQAFLVKHQATPRDAVEVLEAAMADARKTDRKVFVHFGAPWCGWCHKLDAWLLRPDVAPVFGKDYVDCKIDQDRMKSGKMMIDRMNKSGKGGIPWFAIYDPKGNMVITSDSESGNIGFPATPSEIDHFVKMLNETKKRLTDKDVETLKVSLTPPPKPKTGGEK